MHRAPTCPHGPHPIEAPGPWSSAWCCPLHGTVHPLQYPGRPGYDTFNAVAARAKVPVWLPRPLPENWLVTGATYAGDERTGGRATVVACSGPHLMAGPAELLLVAEEPGVGLGARYAGVPGTDAGSSCAGPAQAQVTAGGHDAPLWYVESPADRAAYLGEAAGQWLWVVFAPGAAGALLAEHMLLVDARTEPLGELTFGALSPLLTH